MNVMDHTGKASDKVSRFLIHEIDVAEVRTDTGVLTLESGQISLEPVCSVKVESLILIQADDALIGSVIADDLCSAYDLIKDIVKGRSAEMRGEVVYRTYHKDGKLREDTKGEKIREWLGIVLIVIFFSPVFLIALAIWGIMLLIGKLRGKPVEVTMSTEEKLTRFMTEVMECNTIE